MNEASLQKLPKNILIKLVKTYAKNWITVDGLWFTNVEDRFGMDVAVELDLQMWKKQSAIETKRLLELFGPVGETPKDVLDIIDAMTFSTVFTFEVENVDSTKAIIYYTHCPMQEARVKAGRGEFPCKNIGMACFGICAEMVNPKMKVNCIFSPPDEHPEDCWCKWEFCSS